MADPSTVTIVFHGVKVTLPSSVSFTSDGATLALDFSAGFAGSLQLRAGALPPHTCV